MLDFVKAYDRVDWDFLEEPMTRLGFNEGSMKAVSVLYSKSHNKVIFDGETDHCFMISRSIHQGCPLAPFMYLL